MRLLVRDESCIRPLVSVRAAVRTERSPPTARLLNCRDSHSHLKRTLVRQRLAADFHFYFNGFVVCAFFYNPHKIMANLSLWVKPWIIKRNTSLICRLK